MSAEQCPTGPDCPAASHTTYSSYRHGCRSDAALADNDRYRRENRNLHRRRDGWQPGFVDSIGAARRLRALGYIGWPTHEIARRLGVKTRRVAAIREHCRPRVTRATHDHIAALYRELAVHPGPDSTIAAHARRAGWHGPVAWDRHSIDDPDAVPWGDEAVLEAVPSLEDVRPDDGDGSDGGVVVAALALGLRWDRLSAGDRIELLDGLYRRLGSVELADRVRTTPQVVQRAWERLNAQRRRRDAAKAAEEAA